MKSNKELISRLKETQVTDISFPAGFHKSQGVWFEDVEGNRYMDFSSGFGVVNIGWQHPQMLKAMHEQVEKSNYAPPWMTTEESVVLGEKLISLTGQDGYRCLRATGGADANEILLKTLYAYRQGDVLTFDRSYHGGTHATIGMSEKESFRLPPVKYQYRTISTNPPYCLRCAWGKTRNECSLECAWHIRDILKNNRDISTFFVEPVLGSGGVIVPPENYFTIVADICKEYEVSLVFDEVMTGFGRTGKMFAFQKLGVDVSGLSFAKGMSSGYAAIGAAMVKNELLQPFRKFDDVSATFAWTPMACRVAMTNIRIIEEGRLYENAAITGEYLSKHIGDILSRYGRDQLGEVRSCGLMIGVEWVNNQKEMKPNPLLSMKFLMRMLHKGLMWCASWDYHTMIALPPLVITKDECDHALNIIEDSARESFHHTNRG